jgi:release factor glutamine methyltransferase
VAAGNARRLEARVEFLVCDLGACIEDRSLDVLVSNPPYVPAADHSGLQREVREHEPHLALFAGPTGLEVYERLIADARRVLRPHGWLLVELGYNSVEPVRAMLGTAWTDVTIEQDLAGLPRVLAAKLVS